MYLSVSIYFKSCHSLVWNSWRFLFFFEINFQLSAWQVCKWFFSQALLMNRILHLYDWHKGNNRLNVTDQCKRAFSTYKTSCGVEQPNLYLPCCLLTLNTRYNYCMLRKLYSLWFAPAVRVTMYEILHCFISIP